MRVVVIEEVIPVSGPVDQEDLLKHVKYDRSIVTPIYDPAHALT